MYLIEQISCNDFIILYDLAYFSIIKDKEINPIELTPFVQSILKMYILLEIGGGDEKNLFKLDSNTIINQLIFSIKYYKDITPLVESLLEKHANRTTINQQSL